MLPEYSWLKKISYVSQTGVSVITRAIQFSNCKLGETPLSVICETEVKLIDVDALPVLVTKYFHMSCCRQWCHQPREWEDRLLTNKSEIVWSKLSTTPYTEPIPHTASVWELWLPLHRRRHEGVCRRVWWGLVQPRSLQLVIRQMAYCTLF